MGTLYLGTLVGRIGYLMALDTTGVWTAGDDLRVIECLLLPFGTYVLDCTQNCMNQLEDMSVEAATRVVALLDEYDAAKSAESSSNIADTDGKVLVKADVLEWEVINGGQISGPQQEMNRIRMEVANYFAFCSCLGGSLPGSGGGYYGTSSLIRS